jgi:acetamidase/formamidase
MSPSNVVVFEPLEGTGQISAEPADEALAELDPELIHPLTGAECVFRPDIRIPFEPFCGVMGVAPRERGASKRHPRARTPAMSTSAISPPDEGFLPVLVEGALIRAAIATGPRAMVG